jgi:xanthine dehydrogenase YagR molybdenum-binding subunit
MSAAVGAGVDRADARLKVTGAARYAAEENVPDVAYGVMVLSNVAKGRIADINAEVARTLPGVLLVMTHENAPRAKQEKSSEMDRFLPLLQDDIVRHDRQPVALVIADTFERATDAAARVRVRYAAERSGVVLTAQTEGYAPKAVMGEPPDSLRGDPDGALGSAQVVVRATYTTPVEHHNPMEPHATTAVWDGENLTLYDSTQGIFEVRRKAAATLGIPESNVRVISRYVGGGFGCKGSVWPHVMLAAMGARAVRRPVKVVVARPQMFGSVGFRPATVQKLALGAHRDGTLVALTHDATSQTSTFDEFIEPSTMQTKMLYAVPNLRTTHRLVQLDTSTPTFMRAPGESTGTYALESAMDEMAHALGMDPIAFRLKNYAETDPGMKLPFSSKSLRECYRVGAERFGWEQRTTQPRSMRRGDTLVGMGMATATYPTHRQAASARAVVFPDGSAVIRVGTQDIGTGSYTVFAQVAADAIGVPYEHTRCELGDTQLPHGPTSGGSTTAASVGSAAKVAGLALRAKAIQLAVADDKSPLHGLVPDAVSAAAGSLFATASPERSETFAVLLKRHALTELAADADAAPGAETTQYSMHAFGAQFVEVEVDPDFGTVHVARALGVFGAGQILNAKTARSQFLGGMVWGISMALLEHTRYDERLGRIMTASLADYLVPVNADIGDLEAIAVEEKDSVVNPIGVKGIGEIGITGMAAAVANAVFHATGVRVRDLPITPEKVFAS